MGDRDLNPEFQSMCSFDKKILLPSSERRNSSFSKTNRYTNKRCSSGEESDEVCGEKGFYFKVKVYLTSRFIPRQRPVFTWQRPISSGDGDISTYAFAPIITLHGENCTTGT
ncbi:hypothetical protein CDAR_562271 [Caerostris darwini]|uniref:Uncharacterized protein n=1 Tax=Caerostris darwini TaxID=1538125 RepID=A0AAV4RNG3_9ARAC|nr:hypothetical protein CDAR_562271 [Caerostris darwini]